MTQTEQQNVPSLRFPGFSGAWSSRASGKEFEYRNGLNFLRSSTGESIKILGVGDFKDKSFLPTSDHLSEITVSGSVSDNDLLDEDDLVFVRSNGNKSLIGRCMQIGPITDRISFSGFTIRGRLHGRNIHPSFAGLLFRSSKFRRYLDVAGGGTNISNLSQAILQQYKLVFPPLPEQRKIGAFLGAVDERITQMTRKKTLLEDYKKGCMQQLFSQSIRFKDDQGNDFPDWQEKPLHAFLIETKKKSDRTEPVFSVSVHKGLIDQIEHLGRSFSADDTGHYNRVEPGDIVYTKSPTGDFPLGIIKQSRLDKPVIVSPLYGVFRPETADLGYWIHVYFESHINTENYLKPIIQKGAKNTINITNNTFLSAKLKVPTHLDEQRKIADFLKAIDAKIDLVAQELGHAQTFKKGLLQQMFV